MCKCYKRIIANHSDRRSADGLANNARVGHSGHVPERRMLATASQYADSGWTVHGSAARTSNTKVTATPTDNCAKQVQSLNLVYPE